jgi:hypothetical protein
MIARFAIWLLLLTRGHQMLLDDVEWLKQYRDN